MDGLRDTALLAAPALLDRMAILGGARDWSWREIHGAALELSLRLAPGSAVCNLCNTRAGFLVTWLAALRRGCLQLLPPSGGNADLLALLDARPSPTIVVDDAASLQPEWPAHARCLVTAPAAPGRPYDAAALAWTPDWDALQVCLYTSGTTGAPEPQFKSLGQLARGAQVLAQRLARDVEGGPAAWRAIVCSVPPQHMFGLETSVMLPLVQGLAVLDRRPLLPLDVRAAFERCGGPAAWIATPLHLRALAQSGESLPDCRLALVSTMPLAPALAQQVDALVQAPVLEIYGSTETGVVATRRTARDRHWEPVGDVRLETRASDTEAWGSHFPSPRVLADQIEFESDGRFLLLGRHADLVKIGGRRASLAGLNLLLQDLPGLADGVFYLPPTDAPTERLVLIHAGPLADRAAVEQWLRERMDPVFLPRTFMQVERLPRTANGKLPKAALDSLYAAQRMPGSLDHATIEFEFRVAADHPSLPGHVPGRPIVPGVLVLDHVLAGLRTALQREAARLPKVKFIAALLPDETALVRCEPRAGGMAFRVSTVRDGAAQPIAEGSVTLAAPAPESAP
jgi:acyl-coenzyme A synthetase/AMP-(fatty) acid ligase